MLYHYRATEGSENAGFVLRTLAAGDAVVVSASAMLYATGTDGQLFVAAAQTYFQIAGQLVSDRFAISGGGGQVVVAVERTGSIFANLVAISLAGNGNAVTNDGTIVGGWGVGVNGDENSVTNTGTISGLYGAVGMNANEGQTSVLVNSGTLAGTGEAAAVVLSGRGAVTIINTGRIIAAGAYAVEQRAVSQGTIVLDNSGVIAGAVRADYHDDVVRNSGVITGAIDLNLGNDLYDGRGSTSGATVNGGDGNDVLRGGAGMEVLDGGAGDDVLDGGNGDDLIRLGTGTDTVDGGGGIDTASYAGTGAVGVDLADQTRNTGEAAGDLLRQIEAVAGSSFADTLAGSDADDRLAGADGVDVLSGRDGNDVLQGGEGDDLIDGGLGDDTLNGGGGFDTVTYAAATAGLRVSLDASGWQAVAGLGRDRLIGVEAIIGSAFDDVLTGSGGANRLYGGIGNDRLAGGAGDDLLAGGAGDDVLIGGAGFDTASFAEAATGVRVDLTLDGAHDTGEGMDTLTGIEGLTGGRHDDVLTGDGRDNRIAGGAGDDVLAGGGGYDMVDYSDAADGVTVRLALTRAQGTGGAGRDTLSGFEAITGSAFDDVLTGNGAGNVLRGGLGDDAMDGRGGIDTADYSDAGAGVTVSLAITGAQDTGAMGTDTLANIENITGSAFDDTLTGDDADNVIASGAGTDTVFGGGGDDRFIDALGSASYDGGDGIDMLDYSGRTVPIYVFFQLGQARWSGDVIDTFANIEVVLGGQSSDQFYFAAGAQTVAGGASYDYFVFERGTADGDTILDFAGGTGGLLGDLLVLNGYAPGATFTQVDATSWQVSDGTITETITFANEAVILPENILWG
jgi:Ca2+-binding RTX toxin-like protein